MKNEDAKCETEQISPCKTKIWPAATWLVMLIKYWYSQYLEKDDFWQLLLTAGIYLLPNHFLGRKPPPSSPL